MIKRRIDKAIVKKTCSVHRSGITENEEIEAFIIELGEQLSLNKASVMIGAGFSKNADSQGSKKELPAWIDLGKPFYEALYHKSPPNKIDDAFEVQKLAGEIVEKYERTVLEGIIEKEISDKKFKPSVLHSKLLALPWRDVFTTNYDTLLERASDKYKIITKQQQLRLSKSPRIIKLHGTIPSDTPYIITEKDYQTYLEKHEIFVTQVKNSLIETRFCLIGFSGTDPNFLNWLDWLKRVLDTEYSAKIYFVGIAISDDEKKSLADRNMQVIDISFLNKSLKSKIMPHLSGSISPPITTDDYKDAYSKFFDKLSECLESKLSTNTPETTPATIDWPKKEHVSPHPENEIALRFKEVIEKWMSDRESYPGWVILPESRRSILRNFTEQSFIYHLDKIEDCIDILFLYEFNWRSEKYLYPLFDDCAKTYEKILSRYNPFSGTLISRGKCIIPKKGDGINWSEIRIFWIELYFSLLRYYRQEDMDKNWYSIAKRIEKIKSKLNPEQYARYCYERCLFQLFYLNIQKLREELASWKVNNNLPFWEAKRAGLIAELGDVKEALGILKLAINRIEKIIKNSKSDNYLLFSQKAYMLDLLDYVQRSVNFTHGNWPWDYEGHDKIVAKISALKKYECTPWDDLNYFETALKFDAPDYKRTEIVYGFELNSFYNNEHFGSDIYTIRAYSFLNFMENIGFPFRLPGIFFGSDATKQSIKRLHKFSPILSLVTLVRSKDDKSIKMILTRKNITMFPNDYVNELSKSLLKILRKSKNEIHNGDLGNKINLGISISSVLPEILGRLCIKASFAARKELLLFARTIYCSRDRYKYDGLPKLMKYLVESFSKTELFELISIFLDFPIISDTFRYKYPDPFSFIDLNEIKKIKPLKINIIRVNEAIKVAGKNDERRVKALMRLSVLWKYQVLSKPQIDEFATVLWQFTNEDSFPAGLANNFYYYSTFLWFPHPDEINPDLILRNYINKMQLPIQGSGKSITMTQGNIFLFGNIIGTFNRNYVYEWSQDELHVLIDKVVNWWNLDKVYLKEKSKSDHHSDSIKNEFKARFNNMLSIFACIFQPNIDKIKKEYFSKLVSVFTELKEYGIPDIMARASFVKKYPDAEKNIINDICNGLCSKNEDVISDAIAGAIILLRQNINGRIVGVIGQNIKYRTVPDLHRFLSIMNTIICDYSEYVDEMVLGDIRYGLLKLIEETVIDNETIEKDTHIRQTCRKYSIELSSSLKKYYQSREIAVPNYISEWEKVAFDLNEVAEIRNAWVN